MRALAKAVADALHCAGPAKLDLDRGDWSFAPKARMRGSAEAIRPARLRRASGAVLLGSGRPPQNERAPNAQAAQAGACQKAAGAGRERPPDEGVWTGHACVRLGRGVRQVKELQGNHGAAPAPKGRLELTMPSGLASCSARASRSSRGHLHVSRRPHRRLPMRLAILAGRIVRPMVLPFFPGGHGSRRSSTSSARSEDMKLVRHRPWPESMGLPRPPAGAVECSDHPRFCGVLLCGDVASAADISWSMHRSSGRPPDSRPNVSMTASPCLGADGFRGAGDARSRAARHTTPAPAGAQPADSHARHARDLRRPARRIGGRFRARIAAGPRPAGRICGELRSRGAVLLCHGLVRGRIISGKKGPGFPGKKR